MGGFVCVAGGGGGEVGGGRAHLTLATGKGPDFKTGLFTFIYAGGDHIHWRYGGETPTPAQIGTGSLALLVCPESSPVWPWASLSLAVPNPAHIPDFDFPLRAS
jgi:hypothetical protein